jgi:predicted DCC family thiol-disulfide oxidoreductase YuxK
VTPLQGPVVFVDGECNVCDATVRFLLDHDARGELRYATLQGSTAAELAAVVPGFPTELSTIAVAEPDGDGGVRLSLQFRGVMRALELAGGTPRLARALRLVPTPIHRICYWLFARLRYRLFGRKTECRLPTAEERAVLLP